VAYEMKPNTGSLFKNDKREKDSHPHAKGKCLIDGKEYWVSAWTNTTNTGQRYQSLKFSLVGERETSMRPARGRSVPDPIPATGGPEDDDIPF